MSRTTTPPGKPRRSRWLRIALWLGVIVVVAGLLLAAVVYTEQPSFCRVCHEMTPYYEAWTAGPHNEVSCIQCHVAPGLMNRAAHKFVALKEVWDHFTGNPHFPMMSAVVPNDRCLGCHAEIPTEDSEPFSHKLHVEQPTACMHCHADTGHRITFAALSDAGILASGSQPAGATYVGEIILGSEVGSTLPGHVAVKCSNCHDMAAAECQTCHQPPPDHFASAGQCTVCHKPTVPFAKTVFDHPSVGEEHTYRSFPCVDCHPKSLSVATCTKCHEGGAPEGD